jgi:membrane protein required for beta-lactamase induction
MSNIRGHKVIIEREYTYYFTLLFWFVIGVIVGFSGYKGYLMYMSYTYDEPIQYLCKKNKVYEQVEPLSFIYVKTDKECLDEREES